MALIGGAGNVAGGSNPSGTGTSLNYIGNHAYAYSGIIASSGSQSAATDTALQFETSNQYVTCVMSWANNQTSGTADNYVLIKMDGIIMFSFRAKEGGDSNHTNPKNLYLLIPPYTKFETLVGTSADPANFTVTLKGRVYG